MYADLQEATVCIRCGGCKNTESCKLEYDRRVWHDFVPENLRNVEPVHGPGKVKPVNETYVDRISR